MGLTETGLTSRLLWSKRRRFNDLALVRRFIPNQARYQATLRPGKASIRHRVSGVSELSWHLKPGLLVGTARFELATPCTPSKCATRLRYVPILLRQVTRKPHDRPTLATHHSPLHFYHLRESIVKMDFNSWRIARRCEVSEAGGNRRCCCSARLSELGVRSFRAPEIVKPFV